MHQDKIHPWYKISIFGPYQRRPRLLQPKFLTCMTLGKLVLFILISPVGAEKSRLKMASLPTLGTRLSAFNQRVDAQVSDYSSLPIHHFANNIE